MTMTSDYEYRDNSADCYTVPINTTRRNWGFHSQRHFLTTGNLEMDSAIPGILLRLNPNVVVLFIVYSVSQLQSSLFVKYIVASCNAC